MSCLLGGERSVSTILIQQVRIWTRNAALIDVYYIRYHQGLSNGAGDYVMAMRALELPLRGCAAGA